MTYELSAEDKKRLTEFLGETMPVCVMCGRPKEYELHIPNGPLFDPQSHYYVGNYLRTFIPGNDMVALMSKMEEKKLWTKFYWKTVYENWEKEGKGLGQLGEPSSIIWLCHPPRFAWLVKEFLKEAKG